MDLNYNQARIIIHVPKKRMDDECKLYVIAELLWIDPVDELCLFNNKSGSNLRMRLSLVWNDWVTHVTGDATESIWIHFHRKLSHLIDS